MGENQLTNILEKIWKEILLVIIRNSISSNCGLILDVFADINQ